MDCATFAGGRGREIEGFLWVGAMRHVRNYRYTYTTRPVTCHVRMSHGGGYPRSGAQALVVKDDEGCE